jgi:MFS family permease
MALVGYGIGTSAGTVTFNSLLQAHTPAEARGRVFAGFDLTWQLGRLASLGVGGLAADHIGLPTVYAGGVVLLVVAAAVLGWPGVEEDRNSRHPGFGGSSDLGQRGAHV